MEINGSDATQLVTAPERPVCHYALSMPCPVPVTTTLRRKHEIPTTLHVSAPPGRHSRDVARDARRGVSRARTVRPAVARVILSQVFVIWLSRTFR